MGFIESASLLLLWLTGAAALGQMSFKGAMKHKAVVAKVQCSPFFCCRHCAPLCFGLSSDCHWQVCEGQVPITWCSLRRACKASCVGCAPYLYPSFLVGRKYWESESGKRGDSFNVEAMIGMGAGTEYEVLIQDAKDLWDAFFSKVLSG